MSQIQTKNASLSTGVRLRYVQQGPRSDDAPIVLLHGFTDSWFSFSRLLECLPEGRCAYALDLRGHGESDRPLRGYAITDLAADVAAFLEQLDIREALLVGHSMGSLIAQVVAVSSPERVGRVVLIGSSAETREEDVRELRDVLESFDESVPREFARGFQQSTVHRPVPAEFFQRVVDESCRVPARVWRAAAAAILSFEPTPFLPQITQPALVLWGDRDAYFRRSDQDALMKALPNARLEVFPDVGHSPHWEIPEQVARIVERFAREDRSASVAGDR